MKAKFNLGIIGFVATLFIFAAATNGFNSASAQQQQFIANMSGSKVVPPINTSATGVAKFTVSADGKSLSYIVNVRNINSVIGSHIHFGDAAVKEGPKVLYLFGNPSMTGPPTGKVNGILSKGNSTASDLKGPLAGKQLSDLVNLIKSGNAYVNVHTTQNPKGEIRGQITTGSQTITFMTFSNFFVLGQDMYNIEFKPRTQIMKPIAVQHGEMNAGKQPPIGPELIIRFVNLFRCDKY